MAVDFISSRHPPWKAIKTRLKLTTKPQSPIQVNEYSLSQRKIGPGTYSVASLPPLSTPHRFPSAPRFNNDEKISLLVPNLNRKSPTQIIRGKLLHKKNLDLSPHTLSSKIARIEKISTERCNSLTKVKKTKEKIEKKRKILLIEKFVKRDAKFFKWRAAKYYVQAQKGWVLLLSSIFMGQILSKTLEYRKKIKAAFIFNSSLLYQFSLVIGKLKFKLRKIRRARSLKVMKTIFLPIFQEKLNKMLKGYKETIAFTIDFCLTRRMIKKICIYWRRKITKFENGMTNLIVFHKHRIASLYEMWNEIQQKFNYYSSKYIFPKETSLKILRKYLYEKLRVFYLSQRELKENINKLQTVASRKTFYRTFELTQRRSGFRLSFALHSFKHLRIYNKDELIPLYLEEEAKLHVVEQALEKNNSNDKVKKIRSLV